MWSPNLQQQWNTFEQIENYDDIIYQKIMNGRHDESFYSFRNSAEYSYYKVGQTLHILEYPDVPPSTFSSIRDRPRPTTCEKPPLM